MDMHLATAAERDRFAMSATAGATQRLVIMAKAKSPAQRGARKAPRLKSPLKRTAQRMRAAPATASPSAAAANHGSDDQLISSSLSLHELFQQQARQMLDRADLDEEQKQNILVAMSCPCCGAGAMSYTAKLRR